MKKRFLFFFLVLCLSIFLLPTVVGATSVTDADALISMAEQRYDTLTLDDSFTCTDTVSIEADTTLNLNGKTLTLSGSSAKIRILDGATLTITGSGTIQGGSNSQYLVYIDNGATLTMEGGTITGGTAGGVYVGGEFNVKGSATVTGNTKSGAACNVMLPEGKVITCTSGVTNSVFPKISVSTDPDLAPGGSATIVKVTMPTSLLSGCFLSDKVTAGESDYSVYSQGDYFFIKRQSVTKVAEVILSGATSGTSYIRFRDALVDARSNTGSTLKLLADLDGDRIDVNSGNDFTLDLNGKNYPSPTFYMNGGKLTIRDSVGTGKISESSSDRTIDVSGGTLVIESGVTVENTYTGGYALHVGGGTIDVDPNANIDSLYVETGAVSTLQLKKGAFGKVTVQSGKCIDLLAAGYAWFSGSLTVDGDSTTIASDIKVTVGTHTCTWVGTTGTCACGREHDHTGNWNATTGKCTECGMTHDHTGKWDETTGKCTVCGMTHDHTDNWDTTTGKCSVCGMTHDHTGKWDETTGKCSVCGMTHDHTDNWNATGKCSVCQYQCTHGDTAAGETCGTCGYTIPAKNYVAKIDGGDSYETFKAAYDAAKDGDTITLLNDATITAIDLRKALTLDLAGHTLTCTVSGVIVQESLTLTDSSTGTKGTITGIIVTQGSSLTVNADVNIGNLTLNSGDSTSTGGTLIMSTGKVTGTLTVREYAKVTLSGGTFATIERKGWSDTPTNVPTFDKMLASGCYWQQKKNEYSNYESLKLSEIKDSTSLTNVKVQSGCSHSSVTDNNACEYCGLTMKVERSSASSYEYFPTLAAAFNKWISGSFKLLADCDETLTINGTIYSAHNYIIDLNGHTLTSLTVSGSYDMLQIYDYSDAGNGSVGTLDLSNYKNTKVKLDGGSYGKLLGMKGDYLNTGLALQYTTGDGNMLKRSEFTGTLTNVKVVKCTAHSVSGGTCEYCNGTYVASITRNSTTYYYPTFDEAYDSAISGNTIVLLADASCTEWFWKKPLTIDLNNKTLSADTTLQLTASQNDATTYTFKNGTLNATINVQANATLQFDKLTYKSTTTDSIWITLLDNSTLTVGDNVSVCDLNVSATSGMTCALDKGTFGKIRFNSSSNTYKLRDLLKDGYGFKKSDNSFVNLDTATSITETVTVTACTSHDYNTDGVCKYCPHTCSHSDWDQNTGKCEICKKQLYVAKIGTTGYATFEAAFEAASTNATITLLVDTTITTNLSWSRSLTIDLGGHTLDSSYKIQIKNDVSLTLMNGTVNAGLILERNATLTLGNNVTTSASNNVTLSGDNSKLIVTGTGVTIPKLYSDKTSAEFSCTLAAGTKIGSVSVDSTSGLTVGNFLTDGYGFRKTDGETDNETVTWYDKDSTATSATDVTVAKLPITSVTLEAQECTNNTYTYGDKVMLHADVDPFEVTFGSYYIRWYSVSGTTETPIDGAINTTYTPTLNVGTYTYRMKITVDGYTKTSSNDLTITVKKKTLVAGTDYTAPTAKTGLTYLPMTKQELVNAGSFLNGITGATFRYGMVLDTTTNDISWDTTIPEGHGVNTFTVYWYIDGGTNYESVGSAENPYRIDVTIAPKELSADDIIITFANNKDSYTFTGSEIRPDIMVAYYDSDRKDNAILTPISYTVSYSDNINVGTATVTVSSKTGSNYIIKSETSKSFAITKAAAPTLTDVNAGQCYAITTEQSTSVNLYDCGVPTNAGKLRVTTSGVENGTESGASHSKTTLSNDATLDAYYKILSGSAEKIGDKITFKYTITSDNYADMTLKIVVTLTDKTDKTLAVTMDDWTYGDTPNTPVYTTASGAGTVTVEYKLNDDRDDSYTTSAPTKANKGDTYYIVRVSYETATERWSGTAHFRILPKDIGDAVIHLNEVSTAYLTYDKTEKERKVESVMLGGETLIDGFDYTVSSDSQLSGTNADTYTVTINGENNYKGTASVTWTIAQKALGAAPTVEEKTYDGTTNATVRVEGFLFGTLPFDGDSIVISGVSGTFDNKNVGDNKTVTFDYTNATITGTGSENYDITLPAAITNAKINAKPVTVQVSVNDKTYDGTTRATVTAKANDADICAGDSITISNISASFADANVGADKEVFINDYTVSGNGSTNYKLVWADSYSADIEKANSSILTAPTAKDLILFNGKPQELVNAGAASGGTILYSLNQVTYSDAIPTGTAIGDYTVYYYVQGDSNHNDCAGGTLNVSILPNEITVTVTYAGAHSLTPLPVVKTVEYGHTYNIVTPAIDGFKADRGSVSGTAGLDDVNVTVTYTCQHECDFFGICTDPDCQHRGCSCNPDPTKGVRTFRITTRNGSSYALEGGVPVVLMMNPNNGDWNAKHVKLWEGVTDANGTILVPAEILAKALPGCNLYVTVGEGEYVFAWTDLSYGKLRTAKAIDNTLVVTASNNDYIQVRANENVGFTAEMTILVKKEEAASPIVGTVHFIVQDVYGNRIDTDDNNIVMGLVKRVNGTATVIGTTGIMNGEGVVEIDAASLAGMSVGTILDCNPTGGNYVWALDEMTVVRTMTINSGSIAYGNNYNHDAKITAESKTNGFDITFICTLKDPTAVKVPTYTVRFNVTDVQGNALSGVNMALVQRWNGAASVIGTAMTDATGVATLELTAEQIQALAVGTVLDCNPADGSGYAWALDTLTIVRTMTINGGSIGRGNNYNEDAKIIADSVNGFAFTFNCIVKAN